MYPFGYGLLYTEFEYSEVKANDDKTLLSDLDTGKKIKISAYVKNTGDVDAKTVVQCYVRDKVSKMTRPLRELKGFKKVYKEK